MCLIQQPHFAQSSGLPSYTSPILPPNSPHQTHPPITVRKESVCRRRSQSAPRSNPKLPPPTNHSRADSPRERALQSRVDHGHQGDSRASRGRPGVTGALPRPPGTEAVGSQSARLRSSSPGECVEGGPGPTGGAGGSADEQPLLASHGGVTGSGHVSKPVWLTKHFLTT